MQIGLNSMARRVCRNVRALPLRQAVGAYNAQRSPVHWIQTQDQLVSTCRKTKQRKTDKFERPFEDN